MTVWNDAIRDLPYAHILQSTEWGAFKQRTTGWQPNPVSLTLPNQARGAALILTRKVGPFAVMYVPKGPLLDYSDPAQLGAALDQIELAARRRGAIWLKIDPDVVIGTGVPGEADDQPDLVGAAVTRTLTARGWRYSASQVQYRNTITIDLSRSEDDLLKAMSQSTRYKVRYGPKHGVTVREGTMADLPLMFRLYAHTGVRDGFLTRPEGYYVDEWGSLMQAGLAHALIAEHEGVALAHVILFHFGRTCWYFYGASGDEQRNLMPTYALQWEAMRWAKTNGYAIYDFWGAPEIFDDSDGMWGVYGFKRGFGGTVLRTMGAWDYAPNRIMYALYTEAVPRGIRLLKRLRQR